MASNRKYKLSPKQAKKASAAYRKGATSLTKLQAALRKAKIPASRQSISLWMQAKGKGKRAPSPFWKEVAGLKKSGYTHREATEIIKYSPKWKKAYKERTGKARLHWKDKDSIRHRLRAEYLKLKDETVTVKYEGEVYYETPK